MFPGHPVADHRSSVMRTSLLAIGIAAALISPPAFAQPTGRPGGVFAFFGERAISTELSNAPPTYAVLLVTAPPLTITVTPRQPSVGSSVIVAHCVRLCDGRYFPLPISGGSPHTTPISICKALCPASKTRLYIGIGIDDAFSTTGDRYSSLATAFRYRKELVTDCTCNGKDGLGTATIDIAADPTLRPGDIIATRQGLRVFTGSARNTHRPRDFSPIENYPRLSAILRTKVKW